MLVKPCLQALQVTGPYRAKVKPPVERVVMIEDFVWDYADVVDLDSLLDTVTDNKLNLPTEIGAAYSREIPVDYMTALNSFSVPTEVMSTMYEHFGSAFITPTCDQFAAGSIDCFPDVFVGTSPMSSLTEGNFKRYFVFGKETAPEYGTEVFLDELEILLQHVETGSWYFLGSLEADYTDVMEGSVLTRIADKWHFHPATTLSSVDGLIKVAQPLAVEAAAVREKALPLAGLVSAVGENWHFINRVPEMPGGDDINRIREIMHTNTLLGYLPQVTIADKIFENVMAVRETRSSVQLKETISDGFVLDEQFPGDYSEEIIFFADGVGPIFGISNDVWPQWNEELHEMHVVDESESFIMNGYGMGTTDSWIPTP
jgi:hypothetical protein